MKRVPVWGQTQLWSKLYTREKERNVVSELRQTNGGRITQEKRRITIFSCIGVGHTSTNRPLLAETTVLPLSSIALWCRVALSDCPIHFHSLFLKERENHVIIYYALKTINLLLLLRQRYSRYLVGQHGRAKETRRCLVISVKMQICVLNRCCSVMLPRPWPSGSLPISSPTRRVGSWIWTTVHQWKIQHSSHQNNQTNGNLSGQSPDWEVVMRAGWIQAEKGEMKVQLLTSLYFKWKSHKSWDYSG